MDVPANIDAAWEEWFSTFLSSNLPPAYYQEIYSGYQLVKSSGATQLNAGRGFMSGNIAQMIGYSNLTASDQNLEFLLFAINTIFTDLGTKTDPIDRVLDADGDGMYDKDLIKYIQEQAYTPLVATALQGLQGPGQVGYQFSTSSKSSDKLGGASNITFMFLPGYIINPDHITPEMIEVNPSFATFRGYKIYRMGGEMSFLQTGEMGGTAGIYYKGTTPDTVSVPILAGRTAIIPLTSLSETKPQSLSGITYDVSGTVGGYSYDNLRSPAGFEQVGFAQDGTPLYGFMVDTSRMFTDVVTQNQIGPALLMVGLTGNGTTMRTQSLQDHIDTMKSFANAAQPGKRGQKAGGKYLLDNLPELFTSIVTRAYNAQRAYKQAGGDRTDALSYGFQTRGEQHKAVMIGEPMTLRQIEAATPLRVQKVADRKTGLSSSTLTGTMTKSDIRSFVRGKTIFDISRFVRGAKSGSGYDPRGNHGGPTGDALKQVSPTAKGAITGYLSGDEMSIPTSRDIADAAIQELLGIATRDPNKVKQSDIPTYTQMIKDFLNVK